MRVVPEPAYLIGRRVVVLVARHHRGIAGERLQARVCVFPLKPQELLGVVVDVAPEVTNEAVNTEGAILSQGQLQVRAALVFVAGAANFYPATLGDDVPGVPKRFHEFSWIGDLFFNVAG